MSEKAEIVFPLDWEFRIVSMADQVSGVQAQCLGILHRTDKAATISRGLEFLEENGYIVCETRLGKRYKSALLLTEKGMEVGKKITEKIDFVLDEICIDLTEEQRVEFYQSLAIISDSLELCTKGIQKAKGIKTNRI